MVGSGPHQVESRGSQREDHNVNLKRRGDREVSVHSTHTARNNSRGGCHLSQEKDTKAMQREIDHLKKELCRERRRRSLTVSDFSSNDDEDGEHRQRSRTPLSKSFSHVNEYHHKHKGRNSPPRAWGMML